MIVNGIDAVIGPKFGWEDNAHASRNTCVDKSFMHDIDVRSVENVYEDIDILESGLKIGR